MKFTPENRAAVIERLRAGLSLADACSAAGLSPDTVATWLKRGRRPAAPEDYARFAGDVDAAREAAQEAAMDPAEFHQHLARAVRAGSVQAMKLYAQLHKVGEDDGEQEPADDALAAVVALADRRRSA